jgi:hypothetical protein
MMLLCSFRGGGIVTLSLCNPVERVVTKTLTTNKPAHGDGIDLASQNTVLTHAANVDLHRRMVLSCDQAV